jgi:hypothetical protein
VHTRRDQLALSAVSVRRLGRYDDVVAIHLSGHLISLAVFQQLRVGVFCVCL